ncbi:FAD binding domain-containing protein [Roseinatronobacter sp. NSM]|uniref:FAD binding domain-containing protein n=1 Tax=Roseinatronobacter sp. NSM TaxID=3457785 RepID=UPI004036DDA9
MKASVAGYARAQSLGHAFDLLQSVQGDAVVIAGGQSLVASLNLRLSEEALLVDISHLPELRGIGLHDGRLRLGALTRHAELAEAALVAEHAPLLAHAAPLIAHAAIRSRGTLGGSLANADPAAELPACMIALGAEILVRSAKRERRIAADAFFEGLFTTALEEGEIIIAVDIPLKAAGDRHVIRELTRRSGDYAIVGLAGVKSADGVRLAYFGVSDRPVQATAAMAILNSGGSPEDAVSALRDDLAPESDPHASAEYRRHLAAVLLRRVLAEMTNS